MHSNDYLRPPDASSWAAAKPEKIPMPTYAPLFMALGITFLLFGIVSEYVFCCVGIMLMTWALAKWIGELFHGW